MPNFNYEWWTVEITDVCRRDVWVFKARNKEGAIKQINKLVADSKPEKQAGKRWYEKKLEILAVHWETLKLDHVGYQRWG